MEILLIDDVANHLLRDLNAKVAEQMEGDCVFVNSALFPPLDDGFRAAIEQIKSSSKRTRLVVILETYGGTPETVERLVAVMRKHYKEVDFVVPNFAYSAGTVLALSGDRIFMDYYSVLGPIDPQYQDKPGGRPQPGFGYLAKFQEIKERINAAAPGDCRAELAYFLQKFDPARLFHIEQSIQHGVSLIAEWLPKYKFKNWKETETRKESVTPAMRKERAEKIAKILGDATRWHSHGRGISMRDLSGPDIKLKIDDFADDPELNGKIRHYHGMAVDYCSYKMGMADYIHSQLGIRRV